MELQGHINSYTLLSLCCVAANGISNTRTIISKRSVQLHYVQVRSSDLKIRNVTSSNVALQSKHEHSNTEISRRHLPFSVAASFVFSPTCYHALLQRQDAELFLHSSQPLEA